jgi:hypothetical protein
MYKDVEASENTKLIPSDYTKTKTSKTQKSESIIFLTYFALLSLASYIVYNFKSFKSEKNIFKRSEEIFYEIGSENNAKNKENLISLKGATKDSPFKACQSVFVKGEYLNLYVPPGCISLFVNDLNKMKSSFFMTYCGCETIGPKLYDFVSLQKAKLIGKDGSGLISYIATGDAASITLYNSAEFDSEDKYVIGPNTKISTAEIVRGGGGGQNKGVVYPSWDNAIYSVILQSWLPCDDRVFLFQFYFLFQFLIFYLYYYYHYYYFFFIFFF